MKNLNKLTIWTLMLLLTVACGKGSDEDDGTPTETQLVGGTFSRIWPQFRHDGNPVHTDNFIVYSDGASAAMRTQMGASLERYLDDVKSIFGVTHADFTFLPGWGSRKIHAMADYNQSNMWGLAYRDGIIIRSQDSPRYDGDPIRWRLVVQHEITHVVEFLLIGDNNYRQANSVWFREGIANYAARNHAIQTVAQLEAWRTQHANTLNGGNPIAIMVWNDFPQAIRNANQTTSYYKFFELSVRYLLDGSNGTSIDDAKAFYEDLGDGIPFETAFETHFGMTVNEFKFNWWSLMEDYLSD